MRTLWAVLLLLLGSLELHAGGTHHSSDTHDRLIALDAAHPESDRHFDASASILERACSVCATAARGLGVGTDPGRRLARPEAWTPRVAFDTSLRSAPPLLPSPPRGPPAA